MKKALVITSVASMVDQFLLPNIQLLQEMGYEVHVACNFEKGNTCSAEQIAQLKETLDKRNVLSFQIDFTRSVANVADHLLAYRQVSRLLGGQNYELIHCHSPIGGFLTRLAGRKARKLGAKLFYTAHGFHFYQGAPLKNWLIYYPIEKLCSYWTDVLITINQEDYALAQKKMKAKHIAYVPGVGIELNRFEKSLADKQEMRKLLGVPENSILLLSVGELNENKNHETVIRAIAHKDVHYIIAGQGERKEHLQAVVADSNLRDRVKLLGFRSDVPALYKAADYFVFPSFREGLSVSLMEAMACGLPVACSRIRGNTDLIDVRGGELFDPKSTEDCANAIDRMLAKDYTKMQDHNLAVIQQFQLSNVATKMKELYTSKI